MKAEIIAVGTELLLGQIANTNAQFISRKLAEEGISVYYHTTVGDNSQRLAEVVKIAEQRSDLLIFTGGLGPTDDDITKEVIARVLGVSLHIDEEAQRKIEEFFKRRNINMTPNNIRQALVLEGAHIFPNKHGLAPGMAIEKGNRAYILLPGPPSEMIPMFEQFCIPYLRTVTGRKSTIYSLVLRFYGIGESLLVSELEDLIKNQVDPTIAPYANEGEVTLRITTQSSTIEEGIEKIRPVVAQIASRVGEYMYGTGDDNSLQQVVLNALKARNETLALAESCTGGLVSHLLTGVAGASAVLKGGVVCYTNETKKEMLHIDSEILSQFGAISAETAKALAESARKSMQADWGLSITGVAGPGTSEGKPVGLVYIGISSKEGTYAYEYRFLGSRSEIQLRAAKSALYLLLKKVKKGDFIHDIF